jgi:hypothetical protein
MRTVRHSLQRHGCKLQRVVFCLTAGVEEAAFAEAAAVYFPRTHEEEVASQAATQGEQVDDSGDLVLGRSVFIGRVPADTAALADGGRGSVSSEAGAGGQAAEWSQTLLRCAFLHNWAARILLQLVRILTIPLCSHARS